MGEMRVGRIEEGEEMEIGRVEGGGGGGGGEE